MMNPYMFYVCTCMKFVDGRWDKCHTQYSVWIGVDHNVERHIKVHREVGGDM